MPVRLERLIELIGDAKRWTEGTYDYLPQLACSKCGKGCMPLCGLGLNRKVTPQEYKDVLYKSRKMMIETGKRGYPTMVQVVSSSAVVINYEKAMMCIDEVVQADKSVRYIFTRPIPTMCGMLCKECCVCQICGVPTEETVRCEGNLIKACLACTDCCGECGQGKIRFHMCCTRF